MDYEDEVWKAIEGFEGVYSVSNMGRVRSIARQVKCGRGSKRWVADRVLSIAGGKIAYKVINLATGGRNKTYAVHKLVAIAFLNHAPDGHNLVVDHINGDKHDNRAENLRIITQRENLSQRRGLSKYTGVVWHRQMEKWVSQIMINGKITYLGLFEKEIDAANAYNKALRELSHDTLSGEKDGTGIAVSVV